MFPLAGGIPLRRSIQRPQYPNPCPYSYPCELDAILGVIIPEQIPRSFPRQRRFPQMLRPFDQMFQFVLHEEVSADKTLSKNAWPSSVKFLYPKSGQLREYA